MQPESDSVSTRERMLQTLKQYWGYDSFRSVQEQVICSVLDGRDTLALMPTGAGKSLLYQLPTMMDDGICIVVTPLIALMKDQVDRLRSLGISAIAVHSGLTPRGIDMALDNCVWGDVKFLYIAPERIGTDIFRARVDRMNVRLIAVDEAHCISQWGYDFRPSYLRIARLREFHPNVPVLALTASATRNVADDIMTHLHFRQPNIVYSSFARANLSFAVRPTEDKEQQLLRILTSVDGPAIVYVRTREGSEKLCEMLEKESLSAVFYHGGLPTAERNMRQNDWIEGRRRIMVATNAFGMGIDKADVRAVVHFDVCDSLEAYYQEAGRAGRDGKRAYAVLLVGPDEKGRATKRFNSEFPDIKRIKEIYGRVASALQLGVGDGKFCSFPFNLFEFCSRNRLFAGEVVNALNILQQNGYLVYTDQAENPPQLMFCVSRDDLYNLRIERDDLNGIILSVLRLYPGVFTEFRPINEQELSLYSGYAEERVYELLKELWRLHVVRYIPRNRTPMITFTEERLEESNLYIDPKLYGRRKEGAAERLERMYDYALQADMCRSRFIEKYFGAQTEAEGCGICDVCLQRKRTRRSIEELERSIMKMVAVEAISPKDLPVRLDSSPESVAEALDNLLDRNEISISAAGLIEING